MLLWLPGDSFYSRQMSQKNVGSPDPEKASRLEVQTGVTPSLVFSKYRAPPGLVLWAEDFECILYWSTGIAPMKTPDQ